MNHDFEAVIGLEVHVQLATRSKIFSSAKARLESGESVANEVPNINTTPIDAGHPGTLPVLNRKAMEYAIKTGLATQCKVNLTNQFARKHYFYPDLPKGYQISQFTQPICEHGFIDIETSEGSSKRIGITRIHMEEDAGKSTHHQGHTLVNLNRAGIPLVEVVSEPDMRSPQEAVAYLRKLYSIVTFIGVCDGNMQEGNFRCDANVSIRKKGDMKLGTRTEIKNVNSFRFVEKAIDYEIQRQIQTVLSGGSIVQETRLYDSDKNQTIAMRTKEEADDYRYFPDPDLPPLIIEPALVQGLANELPELPSVKKIRFEKEFGLNAEDAGLLTSSRKLCDFFEESVGKLTELNVSAQNGAKTIANLINGEWNRLLAETNIKIEESKIRPIHFAGIAQFVLGQTISATAAKQVVAKIFAEGADDSFNAVEKVIESLGLKQVNDAAALEAAIAKVLEANPKQVGEYLSGKEKVIGFLVGQAMKAMGGRANPALLQQLMQEKLKLIKPN